MKYDGVRIDNIIVTSEELTKYSSKLTPGVKSAIDKVYEHLMKIHELMKPKDLLVDVGNLRLGIMWRALDRVGIYVPGGLRSYPSTLLMAGIPARTAGVDRIYVSTPPTRDGGIDPAISYISLKLGVTKVYRVGGAQAIAAMAYGTESVDNVDKIVGPGNIYVQIAKYLLQDVVAVDGFEGPTELVIIADESANPYDIISDMKAQAEHRDALIVLISTSDKLLDEVEKVLMHDLNEYILVKVNDVEEAMDLVNELAPEHLSLHIRNYLDVLQMVKNVGAISLGGTPSALIDYLGPNHVLPTNRWARCRGGLTIYDFIKPIMLAFGEAPKELIESAMKIARYEGFVNHVESLGARYGCT